MMNIANTKLYGVLDAQSFKKIFPQQYMKKFAAHLKILQFEKALFANPPQPGKLKFTKRQNKPSVQKSQSIKPKTMLNKFAKIQDTIKNDRQQISRFKTINKIINQNMNNPQLQLKLLKNNHPNEIKTIQNKQQVDQKVLNDMLVESNRQTKEKIKQKLQNLKKKEIFCKFIKRNAQQQGKNIYKSRLEWKQMKKYNSQRNIKSQRFINSQRNINQSINFSKKLLQNSVRLADTNKLTNNIKLIDNKSKHKSNKKQIQNNSLLKVSNQILNQRQQIRSRSSSIRTSNNQCNFNRVKSSKKINRKFNQLQKQVIKTDWIKQTIKIRQNKNLLKNYFYSEQVTNQPWKKIINQIFNDQNPQNKQNQQN